MPIKPTSKEIRIDLEGNYYSRDLGNGRTKNYEGRYITVNAQIFDKETVKIEDPLGLLKFLTEELEYEISKN